jgi:putative transposase
MNAGGRKPGRSAGCPPRHDARRSDLRRGWGSQAFAERLLKLGEVTIRKPRHRSAKATREKSAHGEQEAGRLVAEGMALAGLTEEDLPRLPGSEKRKVAIASVVWQKTTVKMKWIAERLQLRSAANASQQIRRQRLAPPALPKPLEKWRRLSRNVA